MNINSPPLLATQCTNHTRFKKSKSQGNSLSNDTTLLECILKNCFFYSDEDQPKITRVKDICDTAFLSESARAFEGNQGSRVYWGYTFNRARFACMNRQRIYLGALLTFEPPVYSGK